MEHNKNYYKTTIMTNQDLVETLRDGSKRDYIFCIFDCLYKQYVAQALFFTRNSRNEIINLLKNSELLKIKMFQKAEMELINNNIGFEDEEILEVYKDFIEEVRTNNIYITALKKIDDLEDYL